MPGWHPAYPLLSVTLLIASPLILAGCAVYLVYRGAAEGIHQVQKKLNNNADQDQENKSSVVPHSIFNKQAAPDNSNPNISAELLSQTSADTPKLQ